VAVYCVDQFDMPASSFTGGGIKILTSTGQRIFFAREGIINPARIRANETGQWVRILTQGDYTLYALPGGYFWLVSAPDNEGKTFIGTWKDCIHQLVGGNPLSDAPGACGGVLTFGFDTDLKEFFVNWQTVNVVPGSVTLQAIGEKEGEIELPDLPNPQGVNTVPGSGGTFVTGECKGVVILQAACLDGSTLTKTADIDVCPG
jgi:hypothetical protein